MSPSSSQPSNLTSPLADFRLTAVCIQQILVQIPQLQNKPAAQLNPEEKALIQRYHYLMEIYCVVKSGGVAVQLEACQQGMAMQQAEIKAEHADDDTGHGPDSALIAQEMANLDRAVQWLISGARRV